MLASQKYATEIYAVQLVPLFLSDLDGWLVYLHRSVGVQYVDAAELLYGHLHHAANGFSLAHVALDGAGGSAGGCNLARGFRRNRVLHIGQHHDRALLREHRCSCAADTISGAGDD